MCLSKDGQMIQVSFLKKEPFIIHGFGNKFLNEKFLNKKSPYNRFRKQYLKQKHSDVIHIIKSETNEVLSGDGFMTSLPQVLLVIKTADCLPVLLIDTRNKVIGAVHCGWRGTGKRILQKALTLMKEELSCQESSLFAALGPSICGECYEVGTEVYDFYKKRSHSMHVFKDHPEKEKKYFLDLKRANQLQLHELGVGKDRIFCVDECTYENRRFLSYRRNRNKKGRMLNFIGMSFDSLIEKTKRG